MQKLVGYSLGLAVAFAAVPSASAASWLEQKLREVDRNICQNYQNVKCKARKARAAKPAKPVAKPAPEAKPPPAEAAAPQAEPPVEAKPQAEAEPQVAVPRPRMKPKPEAPAETVIAKSPPPKSVEEPPPQVAEAPDPQPEAKVAAKAAAKPDVKAEGGVEEPLPIPVPKPRAKPKAAVRVVVADPPEVDEPPPKRVTGNDNCLASLALLKVKFNVITKPVGQGSCRVKDPVELVAQAVDDNTVVFPDKPTVNCAFAVQFAQWMAKRGEPIASDAGTHVAKFYTGPGYQCRGRNGDSSAKISEHGYGNAIDIERMEMAGGKIMLVGDGNQRVVQAMRKSACEYFTTVLGPGANAAHAHHLHFDMGQHGRSGTYRICE